MTLTTKNLTGNVTSVISSGKVRIKNEIVNISQTCPHHIINYISPRSTFSWNTAVQTVKRLILSKYSPLSKSWSYPNISHLIISYWKLVYVINPYSSTVCLHTFTNYAFSSFSNPLDSWFPPCGFGTHFTFVNVFAWCIVRRAYCLSLVYFYVIHILD